MKIINGKFRFERGKAYAVLFNKNYFAIFHEIKGVRYIEDIFWYKSQSNSYYICEVSGDTTPFDYRDIYFELTEEEFNKHFIMEVL